MTLKPEDTLATNDTNAQAHPDSTPPLPPSTSSFNWLDHPSREHVDKLCEQLLSCSKISVERWKDPLLRVLGQLDSYLDEATLTRLGNANAAQARVALERVNRDGKGNATGAGERRETVLGDWSLPKENGANKSNGDDEEQEARENRREIWRNAAMLLSSADEEGNNIDESGEDHPERHLRDMSTISGLSVDEAWLEVESMAKTPILSLRLETTETTLAAVSNGEATLGISFEPDVFEGNPLFGREGLDLDEDDLRIVDRLGGTFHLTTTKKCLPRLERLVEFLAFALISLRLEAVLLDDLGCSRPVYSSPTDSLCPSPTADTTFEIEEGNENKEEEREEQANTSAIDPKLPGSYDFDDGEPDDDWNRTKRSWKSSFSNSGVLAWMRLANPRAQLPEPLRHSRSLRRSSTMPANDKSPIPLRTTSTLPVAPLDSPSPSPAQSPSHSPNGKPHKIANKLRGIRNQLRHKITRAKADDGIDELDVAAANGRDVSGQAGGRGGRGGNTSVLGLQIVGVNLKSPSWASPWASADLTDKETAPEEGKDDVSIAPTDATTEESEKKPPKRFEKVIEDLSQFILSTSPDVLYPPPHLLFRLRQQELEASLVPPSATPVQLPSTPPSPSPIPFQGFLDNRYTDYLNASGAPRISALQRAHALPSSHSLALNFAEGPPIEGRTLEPEERRTENASSATRIGLDAKAGLQSLMTNNSSLGGTIRHQAMQFLVQVLPKEAPVGTPPCEPFNWLTFRYFESETLSNRSAPDASLEAFVRHLVTRQAEKCSRCERLQKDHVVLLLHHDERVEISVSSTDIPDGTDSSHLVSWSRCGTCQTQTKPTRVTSVSGSYSFAKFVEVMLYDPNFLPVPELCEHASTERTALARYFAVNGSSVQLKREPIALYELRLPTAVDPDVIPSDPDEHSGTAIDSVDVLIEEIHSFFASARAHLVELRGAFVLLPSTPPASPPNDTAELSASDPPPSFPLHSRSDSEQTIVDMSTRPNLPSISQIVEEEEGPGQKPREVELLRRVEQFLDREEQACLEQVERLSPGELNLGRSTFEGKAQALKRRLAAWEEIHRGSLVSPPSYSEPDYFSEDAIALPIHSSVLLRPGELSSVLAVALSTPDFKEECQVASAASSRRVTPSTPSFVAKSRHSSLRLPIPTFVNAEDPPTSSDPDDFHADFTKPSPFELVAKPKKPSRTTGSVFRNLDRKKSGEISGPSTPTSEHGAFTLDSKKRTIKDSVLTDFLKTKDVPTVSSRTPRAVPSIISGLASRREGSSATTLSLTDDVLAQFTSSGTGSAAGTIRYKVAPSSTSSVILTASSSSSIVDSDKESSSEIDVHLEDDEDRLAPLATEHGSNSSRLLDGIRYGLDSLRTRASGSSSPRLGATFDEHLTTTEHVKLKMTHGDKKHTVTAYFPRRFRDLRAKCGLSESLFIESLSRCNDLNPSGGKSTAAFLMTGNQRFMLKELVSKFGYSELDSLLTFAPRLLDYQMQADRPSLLSKIFGIYSIKIQDLKTGEKKKLDIIVMDNLFHSQTISRQFDLKGIASRVAKPKPGEETKEGSTGWDSDWLEGSLRNQLLLYPHSRTLLLDSVSNDVEFLSSNGNIDFSLLVGVDDSKCTLVVGLIDTLGVFNTLKVLEHSAKKGIKMISAADASSVTVCPPTEYAKRFLSSMETYFVAVPDKWSKPPGGGEVDPDPRLACPL